MKRVRMLLRVSSNQQLEADGDLSIQRQLVKEYARNHSDWILDKKEYFEGSNSGYKNSVKKRDVLQEALNDAKKHEYDILIAYKDDRIGRLMWEIGAYVMTLKSWGVDIYTVKDGCISPETDDIMGQMLLALRYANAQKSSADTGMRVKDTAQKLVEQGRFLGGYAPYGYKLTESNERSKHGRVLHHLEIVPAQAEVIQYIYHLSLNKEFGSVKIARTLNENEHYKSLAPHEFWKSSTITSILTNPIYTGHTAYKRRERVNGSYHRLNRNDWILSLKRNETIAIIDCDTWNMVQDKRKQRGNKYCFNQEHKDVNVIRRNDGILAFIDVAYCGYCGHKLVNGSRYNYWTIKESGEKKSSKTAIYKCQTAAQGVPHAKTKQFRADKIEPLLFHALSNYIANLQRTEAISKQIQNYQNTQKETLEKELKAEKHELYNIQKKIEILESKIPTAIMEQYPLSLKELLTIIQKQKQLYNKQQILVKQKETKLQTASTLTNDLDTSKNEFPSWQTVFQNADLATKRVLINKLIERIDLKKDEIVIRFKITANDFLPKPQMSDDFGVPEQGL